MVHVAFGLVAFALGGLTNGQILLLLTAALLHNVLLLPRYTRGALERPGQRLLGTDAGIVLYPAVLLACAAGLPGRPDVLAVVWTILAFGDGAATLVGMSFPAPELPWNPRKSWAGSIAFVAAGTMASAAALRLVPRPGVEIPGVATAWSVAILVAVVAAGIESLDSRLDDNLVVPPVTAAVSFGLLWGAS